MHVATCIYANSPGLSRSLSDKEQISWSPIQLTHSLGYTEKCSKYESPQLFWAGHFEIFDIYCGGALGLYVDFTLLIQHKRCVSLFYEYISVE